jgi:hypothetical protein
MVSRPAMKGSPSTIRSKMIFLKGEDRHVNNCREDFILHYIFMGHSEAFERSCQALLRNSKVSQSHQYLRMQYLLFISICNSRS